MGLPTENDSIKRRRQRKPVGTSVRLEDVAKMAGVPTATASRVINSPAKVQDETRERVQSAIRVLNWIPHGAAKALASLRTRTVGALIPNLGHQSITAMIETMQQDLGDAGYTLLLGRPDLSLERTLRQARKMVEHGVECLVLMGEDQPPELMEFLRSRNVFYVICYTSGHHGLLNCIGFDNYLEMTRVTEYLLGLGHRDFALITRSYDGNDRIRQRIEAVRDTLACAGLAIRPQHDVIAPSWQIGAGRDGMQTVLSSRGPRPSAVICANDYLAAGALIESKANGLRVPDDLSITGFDDIELAAQLDPPLTTVRVPAAQIGHEVARFVTGTLENGQADLPARLPAELIVRGSTGAPALVR